jgi:hypothetical protein
MTMRLNRPGAVNYARTHWNTVCDDGVFWFTDHSVNVEAKRRELSAPASAGWEFRFLFVGSATETERAVFQKPGSPDILVGKDPGIADCAHFLSRCLKEGGKADIKGSLDAGVLVNELKARHDVKVLAEKVSKTQGDFVVKSGVLKPGDMIGYFNISPHGDYGGARAYTHSTMFVGPIAGEGRITCHTICRFGGLTPAPTSDVWHLDNPHYAYTLIHFSEDDAHVPVPVQQSLAGWWELSGPFPVYQHVDGRKAYFTLRKPASPKQNLLAQETATLFNENRTLSFIWRKTGTVDVWTANSSGGFDVLTNGMLRRTATRLF